MSGAIADLFADRSWSEPEDGGVIAQFWNPPRDIDVFRCEGSPDAAATAVLLAEWNAYKESLGAGAAAKRYARLVAVQSSELEGVFLLGGGSLSNVVRDGLRAEAVDEVVQGPPSGVEGVIEILQDFDNVSVPNISHWTPTDEQSVLEII